MATRSLTEVFILMRNNALQNRHLFSDQGADDRMALVSRDTDPEMGIMSARSSRLPPDWVNGVEEVQFEITRIKDKMKELAGIHDKHLHRPTLDDSMAEEHAIEIHTKEITQMFMRCQRLVKQISLRNHGASQREEKLTVNITSSLAKTLQDLSTNFKKGQSAYLKKLKMRDETSKQYFESDLMPTTSQGADDFDMLYDKGFTEVQLQAVGDNSTVVQEREREINQIAQSIQDLNEVFKDLATLVVDQGTILDRIDYNIEKTSVQVDKGLQHLQKAEKYQKKSRKMIIVVVLFALVILLIVILIAVKS